MKRSRLPIGPETHPTTVWRNGKPLQSLGFTRDWAACDIGYARHVLAFQKTLGGIGYVEADAEQIDAANSRRHITVANLAIRLKCHRA